MGSLVLELRRDALDKNVSVADLLRKALVVARKLVVKEFEEWIDGELNGYKSGVRPPDYRTLSGSLKILNPYHGWQPLLFEDSEEAERLSKRPTSQSIGQLASMKPSSSSGGTFVMHFDKGKWKSA